jgi:hypothetical protein
MDGSGAEDEEARAEGTGVLAEDRGAGELVLERESNRGGDELRLREAREGLGATLLGERGWF